MLPALLSISLALPAPQPVESGPPGVHGTVRYADGRPAAGCRVLVLHPAFDPLRETHCDANGEYRLELDPGIYNAIAILDEGYGKTTLEFWAWNVRVAGDLTLDATIGRLEVYSLAVWPSRGGSPSLFLSFRPMSLARALANEPPRRVVLEADTLTVRDIAPALTTGSVRVTVDSQPVEVESLQWYYERTFDRKANREEHMRVALVQLHRPSLAKGPHLVRVRITDARTGDLGEGVIMFDSNEAGLGF